VRVETAKGRSRSLGSAEKRFDRMTRRGWMTRRRRVVTAKDRSRSFGSAEKRFAQDDTAWAGGDCEGQKQVLRLR
jgi:hypothetical protein